jgi:peptidyl-dipeptidase Dcp
LQTRRHAHELDFVPGIELSAADQDTLKDLNARLTVLQAEFGRKLLAGANAASVLITDEAELDGLSDAAKAGARAAAESRGSDGWLLEMQLFSHQHVLSSLTRPDVRARVQAASENRGRDGSEHDTRATLLEMARLRAERARLLGYEHHAAYVAEDATAGTTEAVDAMLARLAPPAVANARAEHADLEALAGGPVAAADWSYHAEAVRKERFSLDDALLRPYLELERVARDGVFRAATLLFGLSFTERADLTGYHPDVRVFEVFDQPEPGERNQGLGLFVADWFTRESKRGGAWMNNLVDQNHLLGQKAVVVNNLNIVRAPAGEPTLLSWDEVITMFHEFGHALHGLLSDVRYPSQSGTNVPRDFVEYPSQVNEMWAWDPDILAGFAVHHETGEPMPREWIDTMLASRQYGEGFSTTEYLGAALLDQAWHQLAPEEVPATPDDVAGFERASLAAAVVLPPQAAAIGCAIGGLVCTRKPRPDGLRPSPSGGACYRELRRIPLKRTSPKGDAYGYGIVRYLGAGSLSRSGVEGRDRFGRRRVNVEPLPGVLSALIWPPWASAIWRAMDSPRPAPPSEREGSALWKRSKMRGS